MKGIGWVHPECERDNFMVMARGVAAADKHVYLRCLLGLVDHDASDVADAIDFPVLILAGGRDYVTPDDVRAVIHGCLRHRLGLSYEASAEGISPERVLSEIVKVVAVG